MLPPGGVSCGDVSGSARVFGSPATHEGRVLRDPLLPLLELAARLLLAASSLFLGGLRDEVLMLACRSMHGGGCCSMPRGSASLPVGDVVLRLRWQGYDQDP